MLKPVKLIEWIPQHLSKLNGDTFFIYKNQQFVGIQCENSMIYKVFIYLNSFINTRSPLGESISGGVFEICMLENI